MNHVGSDTETIVVFSLDDEYLFRHYFERQDVFRDLSEYYNSEQYRFEVPEEEFETVEQRLREVYYELRVVDPERYCVVVEKYDKHAAILRDSVANWERRGHRFFLMKDDLAVEKAVDRGATPLSETEFVLGL